MINYYIYHLGTGTLIDAKDDVFVFSDEDFTNEEKEALADGDTDLADGAGVKLMTLVRHYVKQGKKGR